jgi:hypothetical protein
VEAETLVRAAQRAPVVGPAQPWALELHGRGAVLYEVTGGRRDGPCARDRLLTCGAVLTNVWLAVRAVGRAPLLELGGQPERPEHVATVRAEVSEAPAMSALADHAVIDTVAAMGELADPGPADPAAVATVVGSTRWPGVALRPLAGPDEAAAMAELALHACRRLDGDRRLTRELAPWTSPSRRPHAVGSAAEFRAAPPLVTVTEPHRVVSRAMTARIAGETVLVALAVDDGRHDRLFAGAAVQSARLAAARLGLVLSPMTRLLHLPEVRAELIERLGLAGFPQALLRLGGRGPRRHRPG